MDFDGVGLCFSVGRQSWIHAVFYSLNGNSIMESFVQRSGALIHLDETQLLVLWSTSRGGITGSGDSVCLLFLGTSVVSPITPWLLYSDQRYTCFPTSHCSGLMLWLEVVPIGVLIYMFLMICASGYFNVVISHLYILSREISRFLKVFMFWYSTHGSIGWPETHWVAQRWLWTSYPPAFTWY